jgi:hypothetical protein
MENNKDKVTYIGTTDYRGGEVKFGIKEDDRLRHTYVIGKTGMGKSTLLENMAIQDILNGEGVCVIDPHGSMAERILKYVPEHRIMDVVYFAPFDAEYPVALNVLEHVEEDKRHLVSSGLMNAFKKVFGEEQFSGRMVYLLLNAILSLLENEGESLMGINRIFSDKNYRRKIISNIKDPSVMSYWTEEFAKYTDKYVQEATPAIQNKIGQFISNPVLRNIVGQHKTSFDMREIMDKKKILICNLSIGLTGKENVDLIGSLLITKIYLAAMSRADLPEKELKASSKFYFYVDEFQNFVNDSFAEILSQSRKYNLGLIMAHQYIEQLTDEVKAAVFGNVGTLISFRVGATDAEILEKEFAPQFTMDDIVNLSARQVYMRLSIDGAGSKPFSARTLPPFPEPEQNFVPAIIAHSRAAYSKPKHIVEQEIKDWYAPIEELKKIKTEKVEGEVDKAPESKIFDEQKYQESLRNFEKKMEQNKESPKQDFAHRPKGQMQPRKNPSPEESKPQNINIQKKAEIKKPNNSLRDALQVALSSNINASHLQQKENPINKEEKKVEESIVKNREARDDILEELKKLTKYDDKEN